MTSLSTLKSRANLREFVSEHVRLDARSRGLCPFHREKTPSFLVHAEYWYCHGCHATGDVIDFTQRINHITKGQAIRMLSERYGVALDAPVSRAQNVYMRSLRDQAEFWWSRRRAAALAALEDSCERFFADQSPRNEALAEAAGGYLRLLDEVAPAIRGRAFLALRAAEDNREWAESKEEIKMFGRIFGVE